MSDLPLSAQRAPSASEASPSAEIGRETESAPAESPLTRPLTRLIFWTASLGALIAAAVAIFAGAGAGWNGVILLSGIASVALLLMYALAAGESPKPGTQEPGRHTSEPSEGPTTLKEMVDANHDYRDAW